MPQNFWLGSQGALLNSITVADLVKESGWRRGMIESAPRAPCKLAR